MSDVILSIVNLSTYLITMELFVCWFKVLKFYCQCFNNSLICWIRRFSNYFKVFLCMRLYLITTSSANEFTNSWPILPISLQPFNKQPVLVICPLASCESLIFGLFTIIFRAIKSLRTFDLHFYINENY